MFFGQYLIKEKVIDGDQLVQAIVHQQESMPSLFRVLFENKILSTDKLVDTINTLAEKRKDLVSLILEENLVSMDDLSKAQNIQNINGLTLGQALVDLNFLPVTDLEHHLTNYLTLKTEEVESEDEAPAESKPALVEEKLQEPEVNELGISAAALESLKELGDIGATDLAELEGGSSKTEEPAPKSGEPEISAAALESLKELGDIGAADLADLEAGMSKAQEAPTDSGAPGISAAALESLKELGEIGADELAELEGLKKTSESITELDIHDHSNIDFSEYEKEFSLVEKMGESFIDEFLGTYNEKTNNKLNKIAKFIKDTAESGGDIANFFNSLYRDVHVVKGVSTSVESKLCEKVWTLWEEIIEGLFSKNNDYLKEWVDTYLKDMKSSLALLWEVRNEIEKNKNELNLWNNHDWKEKYLDNYRIVKEIAKKI